MFNVNILLRYIIAQYVSLMMSCVHSLPWLLAFNILKYIIKHAIFLIFVVNYDLFIR